VLRLKFSLGLFENPYCDPQQAKDSIQRPESRKLALEAAQKSIVLLKNQNAILPLAKDKYRSIAVIGPNADQARLGSYSGVPLNQVTLLDGIRKKVGDSVKVLHAQGCKITTDLPANSMDAWLGYDAPKFPTQQENQSDIAAAVKVAGQVDLVILALGENEAIARETFCATHKGDRANLELFGAQNELAQAIFSLGKPVVVYLMNGKPLAIPEIAAKADAVVEGWYMGQETGTAAADMLFGDVNPSGKLTITFPRTTGQLPVYYNHKPGSRMYDYVDETSQPLFPFGFGLSYTTFAYSAPKLSSPTMPADGNTTVSVTVTNTGKVAGDEVVQLYIRDRISSVTRPVKELKDFARITLEPGETRTVTFTLTPEKLEAYDMDMKRTVQPGDFEIMVGRNSAYVLKTTLTVKP
jgi:beta-glucosidase